MMMLAAMRLACAVALCSFALQACGEKTLTAAEMRAEIDKCRAANGVPTPIYDKANPERVFRVDCPARKPAAPAEEVKAVANEAFGHDAAARHVLLYLQSNPEPTSAELVTLQGEIRSLKAAQAKAETSAEGR